MKLTDAGIQSCARSFVSKNWRFVQTKKEHNRLLLSLNLSCPSINEQMNDVLPLIIDSLRNSMQSVVKATFAQVGSYKCCTGALCCAAPGHSRQHI